jgi:lysophospholipase L1-like esterase
MPFTLYVALGDSMSTDHYPTCDVRDLDLPPARLDPLGAAALLHRNDDLRWPEFRGLDLVHSAPAVDFLNLAEDGAMIDDVRTEELARLGRDSRDPRILLTLTAGGNDLLDALASGTALDRAVTRIERRYTDLVETVREELPRAALVLATVYDPSDGTGRLAGVEGLGPLPLEYLDRFNDHVRETARGIRERAGVRPVVLAAQSHRAQRAGRERDPAGVVGDAGGTARPPMIHSPALSATSSAAAARGSAASFPGATPLDGEPPRNSKWAMDSARSLSTNPPLGSSSRHASTRSESTAADSHTPGSSPG